MSLWWYVRAVLILEIGYLVCAYAWDFAKGSRFKK